MHIERRVTLCQHFDGSTRSDLAWNGISPRLADLTRTAAAQFSPRQLAPVSRGQVGAGGRCYGGDQSWCGVRYAAPGPTSHDPGRNPAILGVGVSEPASVRGRVSAPHHAQGGGW